MKTILITILISLALGYFGAKIFFSPKVTYSVKTIHVTEEVGSDKIIEKKSVKAPSQKYKKEKVKMQILTTMLNSSPSSRKRELASEEVEELIQIHPNDSFAAIKTLIDGAMIDGDPILKGDLLIQAAFIEGKQDEVREMALRSIFSEKVPKEKELKDLNSEEEINIEYSDDPKILGIAQYYDAFLATTISDGDQVYEKTIEMIETHQNIKVRRLLAKKYLETFPQNGPAFWDLLKGKNIILIPADGKISIKGVTYQ